MTSYIDEPVVDYFFLTFKCFYEEHGFWDRSKFVTIQLKMNTNVCFVRFV